jgi:predicted DNA binding CopG/RHH family protein
MPEKSKRPLVPKFESEAEEAVWWFEHREMVEQELRRAIQDGTVRRGTAQRLSEEARQAKEAPESRNITIRMAVSDINRARTMAEKKGIGYQTYMKMLLREALDRETRRAG